MPAITDIGLALYQVSLHLYEMSKEKDYSEKDEKIINELRTLWLNNFACTEDKIPRELQYSGELSKRGRAKPLVIHRKTNGKYRLSDFTDVSEGFGDNILAGYAHTAAQVLLTYLNTRSERLTGKGKPWDATIQLANLLLAFFFILPKVDLDHPNTIENILRWNSYLDKIIILEIFMQGSHGKKPFNNNKSTGTFTQTLGEIKLLLDKARGDIELSQAQKSAKDDLKSLNVGVRNTYFWLFSFLTKFIYPDKIDGSFTVYTLGDEGARSRMLPEFGFTNFERQIIIFAEFINKKLHSIHDKSDQIENVDIDLYEKDGRLSGSIYHGLFLQHPGCINSYKRLFFLIGKLAGVLKLLETAMLLAGDGGDILVYYVLGNTLPNLVDIIDKLKNEITSSFFDLNEVAKKHVISINAKADADKKKSEQIWFSNYADLSVDVIPKVDQTLLEISNAAVKLTKRFEVWKRSKGKIEQMSKDCIHFVSVVNDLGSEIEALDIGYKHVAQYDPELIKSYFSSFMVRKTSKRSTASTELSGSSHDSLDDEFEQFERKRDNSIHSEDQQAIPRVTAFTRRKGNANTGVFIDNLLKADNSAHKPIVKITATHVNLLKSKLPTTNLTEDNLNYWMNSYFDNDRRRLKVATYESNNTKFMEVSNVNYINGAREGRLSQELYNQFINLLRSSNDITKTLKGKEPGIFTLFTSSKTKRKATRLIRLSYCQNIIVAYKYLHHLSPLDPLTALAKDKVSMFLNSQKLKFAWGNGERNGFNNEIDNLIMTMDDVQLMPGEPSVIVTDKIEQGVSQDKIQRALLLDAEVEEEGLIQVPAVEEIDNTIKWEVCEIQGKKYLKVKGIDKPTPKAASNFTLEYLKEIKKAENAQILENIAMSNEVRKSIQHDDIKSKVVERLTLSEYEGYKQAADDIIEPLRHLVKLAQPVPSNSIESILESMVSDYNSRASAGMDRDPKAEQNIRGLIGIFARDNSPLRVISWVEMLKKYRVVQMQSPNRSLEYQPRQKSPMN